MHLDSLNWFRAGYNREQAETELKDKPIGTYLVRSSAYANSKYVLSVMSQFNQIIHVVIDESHDKYFLKSQNQPRRINENNNNSNLVRADDDGSKRSRSPPKATDTMSDKFSNSSASLASSSDDATAITRDLKLESIDKFDTLTDLVVFYSKNRLQIGNKTWNIVLSQPTFCGKQQLTTTF